MINVIVPPSEKFNETTNEFIEIKGGTLQLEHSLVSVSKWESKWCKPFLGNEDKTREEIIDYIRCMTINKNVDPLLYEGLTSTNIDEIVKYIKAPMTATTFTDTRQEGQAKRKNDIVTSEIIYYWMIQCNIPVEFERWHLTRLLTLIKVCDIRNAPPKKMSKAELMKRNMDLNAARKAKYNTKG